MNVFARTLVPPLVRARPAIMQNGGCTEPTTLKREPSEFVRDVHTGVPVEILKCAVDIDTPRMLELIPRLRAKSSGLRVAVPLDK